MKKFIQEFKEFALKGNVMDMAVGVVIGGAFGAIITALVDDLLSPLIGLFIRGNFGEAVATVGGVKFAYGDFIMNVINFLIIAFVLFCVIKAMNKASGLKKKEEEPEAPATKVCPFCKSEVAIDATRCPHCTSELE